MNAIALLKEDHERAMELIEQIESLEENQSQGSDLFRQLKQALTLHTQMEEKFFYPALSEFEGENFAKAGLAGAIIDRDLLLRIQCLLLDEERLFRRARRTETAPQHVDAVG